jgi:hypothetical protein
MYTSYSLCPIDLETLDLFNNNYVNNCPHKKITAHPYPNSTILYLLEYDFNVEFKIFSSKSDNHMQKIRVQFLDYRFC